MRIIALDYGDSRIGVAISDELCITSLPLTTIDNSGFEDVLERIEGLIDKYDVEEIVVGLPLHMDGSSGERVEVTREFVSRLRQKISVPIFLFDERLSSAEVERVLLEADLSREKRRQKKDKLAASLILRRYLESHKGGKNSYE